MLLPSTCVRLRYGHSRFNPSSFSRPSGLTDLWPCGTAITPQTPRLDFPGQIIVLGRLAPPMSNGEARLSPGVTPSVPSGGTGMLTCCPSPTARALGLGPTNPTRMTLASEPLDFRRDGFSPSSRYSSQHSHFRLLQLSSPSTFAAAGTLLYHPPPCGFGSVVSVFSLSPVIFSAQEHLTSELLRTL